MMFFFKRQTAKKTTNEKKNFMMCDFTRYEIEPPETE